MSILAIIVFFSIGILLGLTWIKDDRYWIGSLCTMAAISLGQDIIGKEAYIAYISSHWVTPWITVPVSILILIFCIFYIYNRRK